MFSVALALGNRPCAPPTCHNVCKLVTLSLKTPLSIPVSFQSLVHSFENETLTTLALSETSALFSNKTGGGYTPRNRPIVFKRLRTLRRVFPELACRSNLSCGGRSSCPYPPLLDSILPSRWSFSPLGEFSFSLTSHQSTSRRLPARRPIPPRTNPGRPLLPMALGARINVRPETSPLAPVSKLDRAEIGLTDSLPACSRQAAASRSPSRLRVVTKAIRPGDPKGCLIARAGKASRVRLG